MNIPFLDLKAQYATIRSEMRTAVDNVFESQHFILGENVQKLETLVSNYCGCRHAIGVASGTDALLLALKALGVGPGDAVITTSFTFFATAGAIHNLGARPVFIDIEPASFLMDPACLLECLEEKSAVPAHRALPRSAEERIQLKAVLPVHLYGQMAAMRSILEISRNYGLSVVEDAAQAIGASQSWPAKGISRDVSAGSGAYIAGTLGDAGTLSFFPTKNLGAAGDAGMVLTNRDDLSERIGLLRVHGSKPKYVHHLVGYNSRLDELQAAVLIAKFPHLEVWSAARERNAECYRQALRREGIETLCVAPAAVPGNRHIYHQFVVRAAKRDALRTFLAGRGIGTEIYYPIPLHLQRCFEYLGYREGDLPETEKAARESLALPVYPELREEQINYVVESIGSFYNQDGY